MSNMENIESKLSLTDELEINEDPMIEPENFCESYKLELLFENTKYDETDEEGWTDISSGSEINDSSSDGGKEEGWSDISSGREINDSSSDGGKEEGWSDISSGREINDSSSDGGKEEDWTDISSGREINDSSSDGGKEEGWSDISSGREINDSSSDGGREEGWSDISSGREINDSSSDGEKEEGWSDISSGWEINDSSSDGGKSQDNKFETEELEELYEGLRNMADDAYTAENFEETLKYLTKAIEIAPNDAVLYTNRAITNMNLCRYEEAIQDCEATLDFSENYLRAWLYMATSFYMLGDEELYEDCLMEAIERNPDDIDEIQLYEEEFREIADNS